MKFDDLKFVRLRTDPNTDPDGSMARFLFSRIPRYLFEQVKSVDFKIDRLYQFAPLALANPLTFFYVLADKESEKIKGVLWAEVSPLTENLIVHTLSIDKEYQGNGTLNSALEFLEKIKEQEGLIKLQMVSSRTKFYEKEQGWKRSNRIILEK